MKYGKTKKHFRQPSYEEMKMSKPRKEGRNDNTPLPIKYITCEKCKRLGGTLVKRMGKYYHEECWVKESRGEA